MYRHWFGTIYNTVIVFPLFHYTLNVKENENRELWSVCKCQEYNLINCQILLLNVISWFCWDLYADAVTRERYIFSNEYDFSSYWIYIVSIPLGTSKAKARAALSAPSANKGLHLLFTPTWNGEERKKKFF